MSYYEKNKEYFKEYYKQYYLKHREIQIEKATKWYLASEDHRIKHAVACRKYLNANKTKVYFNRRLKSLHKILMKELIDYHMFN